MEITEGLLRAKHFAKVFRTLLCFIHFIASFYSCKENLFFLVTAPITDPVFSTPYAHGSKFPRENGTQAIGWVAFHSGHHDRFRDRQVFPVNLRIICQGIFHGIIGKKNFFFLLGHYVYGWNKPGTTELRTWKEKHNNEKETKSESVQSVHACAPTQETRNGGGGWGGGGGGRVPVSAPASRQAWSFLGCQPLNFCFWFLKHFWVECLLFS